MSQLDDIQLITLSAFVQQGICEARKCLGHPGDAWLIEKLQRDSIDLPRSRWLQHTVTTVDYGTTMRDWDIWSEVAFRVPDEIARDLGALAMRPGGVVILGVLFCATHHPAGVETPGTWCSLCPGPVAEAGLLKRVFT